MIIQKYDNYHQMLRNFIKSLDSDILGMQIISQDSSMINILTNKGHTLSFTDFECVNINTGIIYSKQYCNFIINELDKIDKAYSNQFIDAWHDHLEQDTIYGPTK